MAKRKMYNTTLDVDLLREIKILAAQLDLRQNDLIEEAIRDLIEKYKHKEHHAANGQETHNGQAFEHFTFIGIMNSFKALSAILNIAEVDTIM